MAPEVEEEEKGTEKEENEIEKEEKQNKENVSYVANDDDHNRESDFTEEFLNLCPNKSKGQFCQALVDGTTLITAPLLQTQQLLKALNVDADCENFDELPDLVFHFVEAVDENEEASMQNSDKSSKFVHRMPEPHQEEEHLRGETSSDENSENTSQNTSENDKPFKLPKTFQLVLTPQDYNLQELTDPESRKLKKCAPGIMPMQISPDNERPFLILGGVFIRAFYSIFDRDLRQIVFGKAVHDAEEVGKSNSEADSDADSADSENSGATSPGSRTSEEEKKMAQQRRNAMEKMRISKHGRQRLGFLSRDRE